MLAGNECARLVNRLRAKLPEDAKHSLDANMAAIAPAFDIEVLSDKHKYKHKDAEQHETCQLSRAWYTCPVLHLAY